MNILQLQDDLKNFSEEQLINEMRRPSGTAPQYLVLSEMNRRQRVKSDYQAAQSSDPSTVAEEAVASAGVPASGIMGMAQAMAPKSESSLSAPKPPAMMMREGGVIRAQQGLSIADRNLNPGNMRLTNDPYFGTTGIASGYATFASPEFGLRGIALTADKYAKDPNVKTLKDFVEKYSPAADNNPNNKQYAKVLADSLGVDVDDEIDFSDDNVKRNLIPAITRFEGYKGPIDSNMVDRAIAASKVKDDESKVNELLSGVDSLSGVKNNMVTFDGRPIKPNLLTQMMTSTGEASTQDDKNEDKSLLEKIFTTKIPGSEYIDPIGPLYRFGRDKMGPAISEFYDDYIKGASQGGKEKNILRAVEGPALKKYLDEQEKIELGAMLESDIDYSEPKSFLDTIKQAASSSDNETQRQKEIREANIKSGEIDKLPDAGIVAAGIGPETTKPPAGSGEGDQKKTLTLDEQLVAMQQDLAKSREQDKYLALAQAGLAIMASDKPTLGQAIGEGAGVGLQAYRDAQERYQEGVIDLLNARAKLAKNKTTFSRKDALAAINSYNTQITKLLSDREGVFNEEDKEKINQKIRNLEFQKSQLLPFAGIIGRETTTKAEYMGA